MGIAAPNPNQIATNVPNKKKMDKSPSGKYDLKTGKIWDSEKCNKCNEIGINCSCKTN